MSLELELGLGLERAKKDLSVLRRLHSNIISCVRLRFDFLALFSLLGLLSKKRKKGGIGGRENGSSGSFLERRERRGRGLGDKAMKLNHDFKIFSNDSSRISAIS